MDNYRIGHLNHQTELGSIRDHFQTCFHESYVNLLEEIPLKYLLNSLRSSDVGGLVPSRDEKVLVAYNQNKIIGSAVWARRSNTVYLWGLYICRAHQRRKAGTALLQEIARQQPVHAVFELTVLQLSSDAVSFYQAIGFRTVSDVVYEFAPKHAFQAVVMNARCEDLRF